MPPIVGSRDPDPELEVTIWVERGVVLNGME